MTKKSFGILFLLILQLSAGMFLFLYKGNFDLPLNLFGYRSQLIFILLFEILLVAWLYSPFIKQEKKTIFSSFPAILFTFFNSVLLSFYYLIVMADPIQQGNYLFSYIQILLPIFFWLFWLILFLQIAHNNDVKFFHFAEVDEHPFLNTLGLEKTKWFFLGGVFILGAILRLISLNNFPPMVDEYTHTHAAYLLINGQQSDYTRGLLTVTLPVFLSFKAFGVSLLTARVPMTLLNMLAILPLFSLTKKISLPVAYLSVLMYSVNPWIIALARNVREYAVAPIFIFLILDLLAGFLMEYERFGEYLSKNKVRTFIALFFLFYFPLLDFTSIVSIVIVNYIVFFGLITLLVLLDKQFSNWLKIGLITFSMFGLVSATVASRRINYFFRTGNLAEFPTTKFFDALVTSPDHNWNSFLPQIGYLFFGIGAILMIRAFLHIREPRQRTILLITTTFAIVFTYMSLFMFTGKIVPRMRYGVLIVYYLLPIAAIVFYWIYKNLSRFIKGQAGQYLLLGLFISLFLINYQAIGRIHAYVGGENHFISSNPHYIAQPAYQYLSTKVGKNEVFLANSFYRYNEINGNLLNDPTILSFRQLIEKQKLPFAQVIAPYPSGWVTVFKDSSPLRYGFEANDFSIDNIQLTFHGKIGDVFIWSWAKQE